MSRQKAELCSHMSMEEALLKLDLNVLPVSVSGSFLISSLKNVKTFYYLVGYSVLSQDKEETAQWVAAPGTLKNVIEACLTKISTMKYQTCIVHNFACYDGVLEKVGVGPKQQHGLICNPLAQKVVLDLMLDLSDLAYMAFYSECTNPTVFEFAVTTVKDKLLEVRVCRTPVKQFFWLPCNFYTGVEAWNRFDWTDAAEVCC